MSDQSPKPDRFSERDETPHEVYTLEEAMDDIEKMERVVTELSIEKRALAQQCELLIAENNDLKAKLLHARSQTR